VSGIGFALSSSDLLTVLLKYYPDPLSPSSKRLLSAPESAAAVKSSAADQAFGTIELREPKAARFMSTATLQATSHGLRPSPPESITSSS